MTVIQCTNFYSGTTSVAEIQANTMNRYNNKTIRITDNIEVIGNIQSHGTLDAGATVFLTWRLGSNQQLVQNRELYATSNTFVMDVPRTNVLDFPKIIPEDNTLDILNHSTGELVIPVNGLYYIHMQGVFQNTPLSLATHRNGVYFYFKNFLYPNTRIATSLVNSTHASTNHIAYLLEGDRVQPVFLTNDDNATLVANNNETFVSIVLINTTTLTQKQNYHRLP